MVIDRPVQILIGPEDTQRKADAAVGAAPRFDYRLVAERCNATVHSGSPAPASLTGPKLVRTARSLTGNLTRAAHWIAAAPRRSIIYSTGETWGLPVALAARLQRRTDLTHVVYLHRVFSPTWLQLINLLHKALHVDGWICVTQHQATLLRNSLGSNSAPVIAISQGVDTAFYEPPKAGQSPAPGYILSVGAEMRNYQLLLDAVSTLQTQVVIKVSSIWMHAARRRVDRTPPNVKLISDHHSYPMMRDLYAGAALVVVPLFDTPQAAGITTILEAMAMRKCVVATTSAGLPDVLQHSQTGIVVEPSVTLLQEALVRSLATTAEAHRLSRQGFEEVRNTCSLEAYADRVIEFIQEIA